MSSFDAEELFHLALNASEEGDHGRAIQYLKESIEKNPTSEAYYILAAEHAEIGMTQRALDGMQKAISLNPQLWTAHLQIGLLHLINNQHTEALKAWKALEGLSENDALFYFGGGLTALINENTDKGLSYLSRGIELNQSNRSLNTDMQQIINNIQYETGVNEDNQLQPKEINPQDNDSTKHWFLSKNDNKST